MSKLEHEEPGGPLMAAIALVAAWAAHPGFVGVHVAWFTGWILFNTLSRSRFDPYPFNFLTLVVSLEAILLSAFVLMAQDRMAKIAEKRERIDLQIDLLAEEELTAILKALSLIADKLGIDLESRITDLDALERATDVGKIAAALERSVGHDRTRRHAQEG